MEHGSEMVEEKQHVTCRRTCFCYDDTMLKHHNIFEDHPEKPERLSRTYERFKELNLNTRCSRVESRMASNDELLAVHSKEYIEKIRVLDDCVDEQLKSKAKDYDSIYFSHFTNECARMAVGCTLAVLDDVLSENTRNGIAIIRVLIVDWDIHHGNGTQHTFQSDPSVLYFSIHRYDHGNFWPEKKYSDFDFVGKDEGEGYNINVAWNKTHMNDADYIAVFQRILLPVAYEFCPEVVIVSAGFDSARGDPKGLCDITPEGYAHLTHMLMSLASGKVIFVLEGGYNLTSVAESLCSCVATLLGDPCPLLEPYSVSDSALESITSTVRVHSQYWRNLKQDNPDN